MRPSRPGIALFAAILFAVVTACTPAPTAVEREPEAVDEIHFSYGDAVSEVVFHWRGEATDIRWGETEHLGSQAAAASSAITPVDIDGPFREVTLTGLRPDTVYHYSIGGGPDHTFRSQPAGSFRWVDIGDTGTSLCSPWMAGMHALIAKQDPTFVTHGGDISYANYGCGAPAVHQYYLDQEVWSLRAAFQPVWGNHEYGPPNEDAPEGTPRDSLANYKGRSYVTNARTVPVDTESRTDSPGCGVPHGVNTCLGEDWGWFRAGRVLFISHPEPWEGAYDDWAAQARTLMAGAQADPTIDFVITYGHRPGYSSLPNQASAKLRTVLDGLADSFGPHDENPGGKYVLNVGHHIHAMEVFAPQHGLTHVTNGGGGQGQVKYNSAAPDGSVYRSVHPMIVSGSYDAGTRTLTVALICGPKYSPNPQDTCENGAAVHTLTFAGTA